VTGRGGNLERRGGSLRAERLLWVEHIEMTARMRTTREDALCRCAKRQIR